MECPKCRKKTNDNAVECPYCGTRLRAIGTDGGGKRKRFLGKNRKEKRGFLDMNKKRRSDKPINVKLDPDGSEVRSGISRVKIVIVVGIIAVVAILAVVGVITLTSSKGERLAEDASLYIGRSVKELQDGTGAHFLEESAYYGVNSAVEFDYISESEKHITAQGIKYPSWAVRVKINEMGAHISQISYIDFSVIKNDPRGKKRADQVNLDRFASGAKLGAVVKEIGLDPYAVTYDENGCTAYTYRYYYERDNGDEQAVLMRVVFNKKNKYKFSTAEILVPDVDG